MACLISLYRLYDDKKRLLYVGISKNFIARLCQHESDKDWSGKIVTAKIEYYVGEQAARSAEKKAISAENPIHNISRPSVNGARIKTASVDDETDMILVKIRERGIGFSEFVRLAAKFYINNGYKFPVIDNGLGDGQDDSDAAI